MNKQGRRPFQEVPSKRPCPLQMLHIGISLFHRMFQKERIDHDELYFSFYFIRFFLPSPE